MTGCCGSISCCVRIRCWGCVWLARRIPSRFYEMHAATIRIIIINVRKSSCKVRVILVRFCVKIEFSRQFFEKCSTNFVKIRSVWVELFLAGRRTDRHDEPNSCFSKFLLTLLKISIDFYSRFVQKVSGLTTVHEVDKAYGVLTLIVFNIVPFRSYTLRPTFLPLLETFCELLFRDV